MRWYLALLAVAPLCSQVAILHLKVVEGEGAVHPAGVRRQRALVVQVTDETGAPVEGASVTFHLPNTGPGGLFANGLRTEMVTTDGTGRAVLRNLQLNRSPGPFEIRIIASKEQARAGLVSQQYIAGTERAAKEGGRSKLWIGLALVAVSAAGGGWAAAKGDSRPQAASASPAVPPSIRIGAPEIVVTKP